MNARKATPPPCIYVIAGPNGGGKSSIIGAMLFEAGADYFNPDIEAKEIREANPGISDAAANGAAWKLGKGLLERAIRENKTFAFETTLGGNTIPSLLEQAVQSGLELKIWFVALATPELHIQRVRSRVAKGGHDIPESKICERFERARANLIRLLPGITELRVFDNSAEADPADGVRPQPLLVLHFRKGKIVTTCASTSIPTWAKPIVEIAMRIGEKLRR